MAEFSKLVITNKGQALIAKMIAGKGNIDFTKICASSTTYTLAQLAVRAKYLLPDELPAGVNERYVRLKYTVAGTAPTTGKITAGIVADRQTA